MNARIRRGSRAVTGLAVFLISAVYTALAQAPTTPVARYQHWWLPDEGTKIAGEVDSLFYVILWITGVTFILVFATQIVFMIRYRYREGRRAHYTHGNNRLEIAWTIAPALILIFLAFFSRSVWSEMKQQFPDEDKSFVVEIRPRQFQWDITYAGADGKFGTPDDISAINQLHVPAGKDVLIKLSAQDVIHSFFVPEFRIKQDAVPGMMTRSWFNCPKPGNYEIACAELCGLGHYRMRGYLTVHDQAGFDKWYQEQIAEKTAQLAPPPPAPAPADTTATSAAPADSSAGKSSAGTDSSKSAGGTKDTATVK
jgi:cytochrome c oxidase subunit 2